MEIRKPKFELGQRVIDKNGDVETVVGFNSYHFENNEYWYDVSYDGEVIIKKESYLEPYVEKSKTVWDLQNGDKCCFIDNCGTVLSGTWSNNSFYAIECRQTGNVFLTKEEALADLERRKIETEMLRLGGRRNFKKGERNWYIRYNFYTDFVDVDYNMYDSYGRGNIYFDSEEKAKEIIKTISKDKIRKYIFGAD